MTIKDKLSAIRKVFAIKFLGKKIPLVVTWPITNRCNFRCQYCERWKSKTKEFTTNQVFSIIDELKKLGTIRISLSGGEPLVREDIGQIINYIKSKGISVVLTSNGSLVPQKIEAIKNLDLLKLSIEGREEIHDKIRGKGSFKKVIEAAETLQKCHPDSERAKRVEEEGSRLGFFGLRPQNDIGQGVKFVFNSVLTRYNLDQIGFLLSLAENYKTRIRFTALNVAHAGKAKIEPLFPKNKDYQKAIKKLILAKKKGRPVLNSFAGLEYFKSWPKSQPVCHSDRLRFFGLRPQNDSRRLECFAGRALAHLSAEGKLYPCVVMEGKLPGRDVVEWGLSKAFDCLPKPKHTPEVKLGKGQENTSGAGEVGEVGPRCPGCWCGGTLELNLLLSLKLETILNLKRLV